MLLCESLVCLIAYTIVYDTTSLAVQPIIERIHRFCCNTAVLADRAFVDQLGCSLGKLGDALEEEVLINKRARVLRRRTDAGEPPEAVPNAGVRFEARGQSGPYTGEARSASVLIAITIRAFH